MALVNRYFRNSKLSEARFRRLVKCFATDLTATQTASLTGLSLRSVNAIFPAHAQERSQPNVSANRRSKACWNSMNLTSARGVCAAGAGGFDAGEEHCIAELANNRNSQDLPQKSNLIAPMQLFLLVGEHHSRMKPATPEMTRFNDALRTIMQVSKADLSALLKDESAIDAVKQKRGPRPKPLARASSQVD